MKKARRSAGRTASRRLAVIFKFWLIDDLYAAPYGRGVLNNLTGTPQYLSWLALKLRPHVGDTVLEIGAGIGNLTGRLMSRRTALRRRGEGPAAPARAAQPLPAHAQRRRAAHRSRGPGRSGGPGELFRHGALSQRAGAPGRCRAGAGIAGRHHPARRLAAGAGAQRPGRLWLAGSQDGPQAALQPGHDRPTAGRARLRGGDRRELQQGGAAALVGVRQITRRGEYQQAGAEDFRQVGLVLAAAGCPDAVARTLAGGGGAEAGFAGRAGRSTVRRETTRNAN